MRTLRESGLLAIFDGMTTVEEVLRETIGELTTAARAASRTRSDDDAEDRPRAATGTKAPAAPAAARRAARRRRRRKQRRGGPRLRRRRSPSSRRQLSTLQDAGLPIVRSLKILEGQMRAGPFKTCSST